MRRILALVFLLWASPALAGQFFSGANIGGAPPADSIGHDYDWYLDANSGNLWGPKAFGHWPTPAFGTLLPAAGGTNCVYVNGASPPPGCVTTLPPNLIIPNAILNGTTSFNTSQTISGLQSSPYKFNIQTFAANANVGSAGVQVGLWSEADVTSASSLGGVSVGDDIINITTPPADTPGGSFYVARGSLVQSSVSHHGQATTLTSTEGSGVTSLPVASASGIQVGDFINVVLPNGGAFSTVAQAGTGGTTLVISPGLPTGGASNGAAVYDPKGTLQGNILQAEAATGATNLNAIIGASASAYSQAGATFYLRADFSIERDVPSVSHAQQWDTLLSMSAQSGINTTPPGGLADYGILFGDQLGVWPLTPSGTFAKIGGESNVRFSIANIIDASLADVTGNFAAWFGTGDDGVARTFKLTGSGDALFGGSTLNGKFTQQIWQDTNTGSCVDGSYQRIAGDGAGDFIWGINLTAAPNCNFASGINVWEVKGTGEFDALTFFAAKNGMSIGVGGTITSSGSGGALTAPAFQSGAVASQTCTVNQAKTLIFTNGILTGGTCNT